MFKQMVTKEQCLNLFAAWGCPEDVPAKGKKVLIGFPCSELKTATVTWSEFKSDTGKRLYSIVLE